jgi:hypothetical protein
MYYRPSTRFIAAGSEQTICRLLPEFKFMALVPILLIIKQPKDDRRIIQIPCLQSVASS